MLQTLLLLMKSLNKTEKFYFPSLKICFQRQPFIIIFFFILLELTLDSDAALMKLQFHNLPSVL